MATQETQQEERPAELARQEALTKSLEEEARTRALEQEQPAQQEPQQDTLVQQELEQRKQALQAELARLEQETDPIAGQPQTAEVDEPQPAETDQLLQEKERLAELATEAAEQRKLEELAQQQTARELEQERQRLEREKERLAALQKQAQEEAQRLAEDQRQAELARQREELLHEAELAEQRAAQARLEAEQRKQTRLARELAEQQEMTDLSTEAAIEQLREELGRRSGRAKLVIDETVLAEIVREQMEKLRAKETAMLKAENLAVAKRLLKSAEEYFGRNRLEEALTNYRNAHDLSASPATREAALQGILDTMTRLYAGGNSETWQLLKGDRLKDMGGEYVGHYQTRDETGKEDKSPAVSTMVAHKGNQLTLAAMDLGIVVIANIENGTGDLSFYDTKNDIYGTGTLITDSSDFVMGIEWSSADGSVTGGWQAQNQHTLWHIDLNGEYIAEVTNIHVSVFRKKTFNFTLTDLTTPAHAGNPNEISGISKDGNIRLSGRKVGVNRIRFEFISDAFNIQGNGQFEVSGALGDLLTGTWEIPNFDYEQSSGQWTLRRQP